MNQSLPFWRADNSAKRAQHRLECQDSHDEKEDEYAILDCHNG